MKVIASLTYLFNRFHPSVRRLIGRLCKVLGGLLLVSLCWAQERTAYEWLQAMQQASKQENYQGVFMFSRGEMSSTVQVVHRYQNGLVEERLRQLDGEMGEIIRHGADVICVFPDNRVVQLEKNNFGNRLVEALSDFMPGHEFYELETAGAERLIERSAIKLRIAARDKHRYSYALWLDQETALLLKSSILNAEGKELERFQFTQIAFPKQIPDSALAPMNAGELVEHEWIPPVRKDQDWPEAMQWNASWIPPGFKGMRKAPNIMLYSDGLATYSIFVEAADEERMPDGASMVGATVAYSHSLQSGVHQYGVTVMGEIPAMTAMMIAESIQPEMQP